jgi:hypothetical protein
MGAVGRSSLRVRFGKQLARPPTLGGYEPPPCELSGPDASVVRAEEQLRWDGQLLGRAARLSASHRLEHPKRRHSRSVILADGLTTCRTADEVRNELIAKSTFVVHDPAPFHSRIHGQALLAACPHTRVNQPRPSHEVAPSKEEKRHAGSAVPKADAGI